ncbi:MAG TPA: purine-nucleoside phosphorylase [Spirochaetales bacterium]|nr:purine-nucleoside phosphorylase [Spirochaetales bacterium]
MSIHIAAPSGSIAETILLPGDPLRAKFIAENFFETCQQFNAVRNMFGYTGTWKGNRVSVMGTGMGMPSHSIYVNELLKDYGCKRLVRVGTCGSLQAGVGIRDLVLAQSACSNSSLNRMRFKGMDYAPTANFELLSRAYNAAVAKGAKVHVGPILSSDSFYDDEPDAWKLWARYGVLAVEMESAELYTLAAKYGAQALAVLTVSDSLVTHELTSSEEREKTFGAMMEIALNAIFPSA